MKDFTVLVNAKATLVRPCLFVAFYTGCLIAAVLTVLLHQKSAAVGELRPTVFRTCLRWFFKEFLDLRGTAIDDTSAHVFAQLHNLQVLVLAGEL